MKVLVTGGAGFIGSHLCHRLVDLGLKVIVIDDLSSGEVDNVPEDAELVVCSVADRKSIFKSMCGVDVVFHLAAHTSIQGYGRDLYEGCMTNIMGTISLLSYCEGQSVKKLIFASSAAVYGEGVPGSKNEEDNLPAPISPYGISKLSSEQFICDVCSKLGIDYQILRLFNVFGPGQRSGAYAGVINEFIKAVLVDRPPVIWGDGEQVRDFVYVGDVVNALILAMDTEPSGQAINIGTGHPVTINSLARLVLMEMQSGLEPKHTARQEGEIRYSVADIARAERRLGYRANGSLEESIGGVISWLSKGSG